MRKRTSAQMWQLIQQTAKTLQAVQIGSEGSRNNPKIIADEQQDFDITYFLADQQAVDNYRQTDWSQYFGEILIQQNLTDEVDGPFSPGTIVVLMYLADGNRIDLKIMAKKWLTDYLKMDSLNTLVGPNKRPTSDVTHQVKAPSEIEIAECINEFYWLAVANVAKHLKRQKLLPANETFILMRNELFRLTQWCYFTGENPGKHYSKILTVLPEAANLYQLGDLQQTTKAFQLSLQLFKNVLIAFDIPQPDYAKKVEQYLLSEA